MKGYKVLKKAYGKRLKSTKDRTIYERYPGSDITYTLPAGKPSRIVKSYSNGYYGLQVSESETHYIKKTDDLVVVPPDAEDDSSIIGVVGNSFYDWFVNAKESAKNQVGYLESGFKESTKSLGIGFKSVGGWLQTGAFAVGGVVVLLIIYNLTQK